MTTPVWRQVLVIAVAFATTGVLRVLHVDDAYLSRSGQQLPSDAINSPGSAMLRVLAAQHPLALADLAWLEIVQEIGQADRASAGRWDRVENFAAIAVDLDPRYFVVYHSVGLNLSVHAHRLEASDKILLRGIEALPERWEFTMALGYNAYFVRGDAELGSEYVRQAAETPGSPKYLAPLAGRMKFHGGDEEGAIGLLEGMLPHLDESTREDVESRILILKSERRLLAYDAACKSFLAEHGRVPRDGVEVFELGLVKSDPRDLMGAPITFDASCIARTTSSTLREFEARARVGSLGRPSTLPESELDTRVTQPTSP